MGYVPPSAPPRRPAFPENTYEMSGAPDRLRGAAYAVGLWDDLWSPEIRAWRQSWENGAKPSSVISED